MNNSILDDIKKLLGIHKDITDFDQDIIIHINSTFSILHQLGIGPDDGFSIKDNTVIWTSYLNNNKLIENVKTYIYLKVKKVFDPPTNSIVQTSINDVINEMEWRLRTQSENSIIKEDSNG